MGADRRRLVGVETVEIDARTIIALNSAAEIVGDTRCESDCVVQCAARNAVACTFDQASGVICNNGSGIVLHINPIGTCVCRYRRLNGAGVH